MKFETTDEMGLWQFFCRTEKKNFDYDDVVFAEMQLPRNMDLATALETAQAEGVISRGSHRSGCFQVQTDDGIFSQVNDRRIDLSTARKAELVEMKTWEELDDEDDSAEAA